MECIVWYHWMYDTWGMCDSTSHVVISTRWRWISSLGRDLISFHSQWYKTLVGCEQDWGGPITKVAYFVLPFLSLFHPLPLPYLSFSPSLSLSLSLFLSLPLPSRVYHLFMSSFHPMKPVQDKRLMIRTRVVLACHVYTRPFHWSQTEIYYTTYHTARTPSRPESVGC